MRAKITLTSAQNDISACYINGHRFEFGGPGDGYCYSHQSFNCLDNLTKEEHQALQDAEYADEN